MCVSAFASQTLTEGTGKFFQLPSGRNVNKPARKYNDLQARRREGERETSYHINAEPRLSEGTTGPNLSYQALDEVCTQGLHVQTRTRQRLMCIWERSLLRPFLRLVLGAHVDAIRSFCSTLKSANTGSRGGGRDTQEEQERARRRDRGKERRSEEKNIKQRSL